MGNQMSPAERDVYEVMKTLLRKHKKDISGQDLKIMLKWVQMKIPTVTASSIFTRELWDNVGVKLWDLATSGNAEAQRLLPWWRNIFEAIKAQKKGHKDSPDTKGEPSSAPPLLPPPLPPRRAKSPGPLKVCAAGYPPEEDPLDPGPVDPDKEPDLYPPDPHDTWANIRRQALKEGDLEIARTIVAPVIYQGRGVQWEALSFPVIKELRRTVTEHGLSSPYFASLLSSVFDTYVMTPHDLKSLAQLLLTPSQYSLWESHWRGGLQTLLNSYVGHNNAALAALTMEHLMGTGQHSNPAAQARDCPREALEAIREEAKKALLKIPDSSKPQKAFTSITQEPWEPYMQFIDRLKQALERQIDNTEAREILLLKLAVENANADCKKLLKSLPNPALTLVEMVEACNRIGTVDHKFEAMAAAFAAMRGMSGGGNCYGCGKPGHIKRNYLASNGGAKAQAPEICPRCRKGRHYANQCRSKYNFQGQPIQGNRLRSAGQRRAQTQVSSPVDRAMQMGVTSPQVFAQQQPVAPDWTWQPHTQ
ncbi:endogenous retrovirus group K member 7 Gag polyprotein-like [Larus michahellis]|uniref:endogenous retrovirus group K member 7 Gag polyprotein-like n=1 Tax=Larus michahellis TaxID=119627 RepID=UPI003D9B7A17